MSEPNEPHSVFPDPQGYPKGPYAPGSAGPGPRTTEEWINEAHIDIRNIIFESIDNQIYCRICAPGQGYRLRAGASIEWHANQRQPRTHHHNMIWAVVSWFRAKNMPVPTWPTAYRRDKQGRGERLFCHICREIVGLYNEDVALDHDEFHNTIERQVMRPNRIGTENVGEINIRPGSPKPQHSQGGPRKQHVLDGILAAMRGEGVNPTVRDEQVDPYEKPGAYKERLTYLTPEEREKPIIPAGRLILVNGEHIAEAELMRLIPWSDDPGADKAPWSVACAVHEQHGYENIPTITWPCAVPGCNCLCHETKHDVTSIRPDPEPSEPSAPEPNVEP